SDSDVVLRDHRPGCRPAGARAVRVIVSEADDREGGDGAALFELRELLLPHVHAPVVWNLQLPRRGGRVDSALEPGYRGDRFDLSGHAVGDAPRSPMSELAVAPNADVFADCRVPDVSVR